MSIVQAHLPAAEEREERMLCHDEQGRYTYLSTSDVKDDRQRFLQKVSKKQFRTVYYDANG